MKIPKDVWPLAKGTSIVIFLMLIYFWQSPVTAFWLAAIIIATVIHLYRKQRAEENGGRENK